MRAIVFDGQLRLVTDHPDPVPERGQARIRTLLTGVCNTDIEIVQGYAAYRGVLGHEFVGIVDRTSDSRLRGRRVVGEINAACGTCQTCRAGRPAHCPSRRALGIRALDGTLADWFCLPARNLHLVPDCLPDEVAVFAEPLAAASEVLEQVHVRPLDRVVVLGDGKLGLLVAQVVALTGCDLLAVGRHQDKLDILARRGITTQLGEPRLAPSADVVIDCTGHPDGYHLARRLVRPRGTLVLKSTYHGSLQADLSALVVDEVHVVGSRCGPFPAALRLLERGWVDTRALVAAVYPLAEAVAAFEHARRPGTLKVLVRP